MIITKRRRTAVREKSQPYACPALRARSAACGALICWNGACEALGSLGRLRYWTARRHSGVSRHSAAAQVGDHYQLPPLVTNVAAEAGGLGRSLFRILCEAHPQANAPAHPTGSRAPDVYRPHKLCVEVDTLLPQRVLALSEPCTGQWQSLVNENHGKKAKQTFASLMTLEKWRQDVGV